MGLKILRDFYKKTMGINYRNLGYIYTSNPRKYFPIADDKILTKKLLSQANIPMPETYQILSGMGEIGALWSGICRLDEFVIKPARGKAGGGIIVLKKQGGSTWSDPSGCLYGEEEVKRHIADIIFGVYSFGLWDRAMIEYLIYQHPVFQKIYPQGVTDIRVIVYNDTPKIAMIRMPTSRSGGKANLHQDAIGIGVDMVTGRMTDGYDYKSYFDRHPDSGVAFKNLQIPFWQEILEISEKASRTVPLNYIGVDVVIDKVKGPLVMEINARPGLEIQNVNRRGLREVLERKENE